MGGNSSGTFQIGFPDAKLSAFNPVFTQCCTGKLKHFIRCVLHIQAHRKCFFNLQTIFTQIFQYRMAGNCAGLFKYSVI